MEAGFLNFDFFEFLIGYSKAFRIKTGVNLGLNFQPRLVVVPAIKLTMTSWLIKGFPRQFILI